MSDLSYFYIIKVEINHETVEVMRWDNLRFETRMKYDWYFKYRAALLQVKYPKARIEIFSGKEEATGKTLEQLKENKIRAKKATITKYKNKLSDYEKKFEDYKKSYAALFPIQDDLQYQCFKGSLKMARIKIQRLESELEIILK